jgi:hypothetical protein
MRAYRVGAIIWALVGLGINAFIHFSLAPSLDQLGAGSTATVGTLFRVEAVADIVAGVLLLIFRRRWTGLLVMLVSAVGLAILIASTIAPITLPFGLPVIPVAGWGPQKLVAAVGQAIALVSGLTILVSGRPRR